MEGAGSTTYGRLVRFALLTAQRQDKIAGMRWDDLEGNVWKIRTEDREKGNAGELVLPEGPLLFSVSGAPVLCSLAGLARRLAGGQSTRSCSTIARA